jgi:hypothetical protein
MIRRLYKNAKGDHRFRPWIFTLSLTGRISSHFRLDGERWSEAKKGNAS